MNNEQIIMALKVSVDLIKMGMVANAYMGQMPRLPELTVRALEEMIADLERSELHDLRNS